MTEGFKVDDYFIWTTSMEDAIEKYLLIKRAKNEEPNMELLNNIKQVIVQNNVSNKSMNWKSLWGILF